MGCTCFEGDKKKRKKNTSNGVNSKSNDNNKIIDSNNKDNNTNINKSNYHNKNEDNIEKSDAFNEKENKIGYSIKKDNSKEISNTHNKNQSNVEKSQIKELTLNNNKITNKSQLNNEKTNDRIENFHQINSSSAANKTKSIFTHTFYKGKKKDSNFLGEGGCGEVVKEKIKYKDEYGNDKIVACKYIKGLIEENENDKNSKKEYVKRKKNFIMNFFRESSLMVNLFHKNIVKLISIHSAKFKLVMEYMEGGSLSKVIYKKDNNLSKYFKIHCLFQICDGLKFLHDRQIIHGDLKSANILLDKKYDGGDDYPTLKLNDFGFSGIKEDINPGETPGFGAPELFTGNHKRTVKSDIFSFGVVIYEIFKGESPNKNRIINETNRFKFFPLPDISQEEWPKEIKNIILDCTKNNTEERPNIDTIKNRISEYCNNSGDIKLIDLKNNAIKEVNFDVVNINDFACKLFEGIKSISSKKYGEFVYKVNDTPFTGINSYRFEDGTKYLGTFENGRINKYGIFFYFNGIQYNGEHLNGVWNGKGIFKYGNDIINYKGYFQFFQFNEFGIISTIQKFKGKIIGKHEYTGDFKGGRQNGYGIYTDPEGRKYSGEWKDGNFGGIGKFEYPDGEVCEGEFAQGKRHGICFIKYEDGSSFEGHCEKGKFNGRGKFVMEPGTYYDGNWKDGYPLEDDKLVIKEE